MKQTKLFLSLLVLAGVLLSACGGGAPAPAQVATAVSGAATKLPEAATAVSGAATQVSGAVSGQPFSCTDKLGCIDIGPTDPVHIAYLFVTSGANSTLGLDTKYGAELALDDAGGKVLGHDVKFDGQDSGYGPEGGQTAGTKVAADKTVVAVIGTNCSSEARAAAMKVDPVKTVLAAQIAFRGVEQAEISRNAVVEGNVIGVLPAPFDQIGGTVDVISVLGQGTTLKIRIPLTPASIPGLMVSSDGERPAGVSAWRFSPGRAPDRPP